MKVLFLYRDAANYKARFVADVVGKEYKVGDEEHMENLGFNMHTLVPEIMEFPIDEDDHSALEVEEIGHIECIQHYIDKGTIQWQERYKLDAAGWLWEEVKQTA